MKKIGIVTTSRADYGLYLPIIKKIKSSKSLKLQLYVSGMHLMPEYGHTADFIRKDGFAIESEINLKIKDTPLSIAKAMGEGTKRFAEAFEESQPDILLILGDRFEMHCAAVAAIPFGIPIAHIHGGELTYGAFDEYFRHSLTKLSQVHFAATEQYANRIKQMGENPAKVFVTGAPGIDNILNMTWLSQEDLAKKFKIDFAKPILLTTFHPVTMESENTLSHIENLLNALSEFDECAIVFTHPNMDTNSRIIAGAIKKFVNDHAHAVMVENFGQLGYLSMLNEASVMVGNSSSGIIEAASFKLPVINIGKRQEGRQRGKNVIDVGYAAEDIKAGIKRALSDNFINSLADLVNPYGDGRAAERIAGNLEKMELKKFKVKEFFDQ
ncbi:MAG: UDP-N-acetylglucosamine 2-epimerase (hydrolyzing) [Candidatus Omnitrophica bacterium]|nr:UDP-N-acetylglucosamine 2-epimerase (hydrolyzing) [Candidatus Omnitrophota bacterium]